MKRASLQGVPKAKTTNKTNKQRKRRNITNLIEYQKKIHLTNLTPCHKQRSNGLEINKAGHPYTLHSIKVLNRTSSDITTRCSWWHGNNKQFRRLYTHLVT